MTSAKMVKLLNKGLEKMAEVPVLIEALDNADLTEKQRRKLALKIRKTMFKAFESLDTVDCETSEYASGLGVNEY